MACATPAIHDIVTSEFDLIARYFMRKVPPDVTGGGDDCALFSVPAGMQVATSTDLLLEGRHFFSDVDPRLLGHKALAVNLSDLAAMGARPLGCLLGLGLPTIDEPWVAQFAEGFYALAEEHGCPLLGGDTTRSRNDITLGVTVFGAVDPACALRRSAAQVGDDIWVSGELGAADVACRMLSGELATDAHILSQTRRALEQPTPRLALGQALTQYAHAAIDVSDGLLQDLTHILRASGVAARVDEPALPIHPALRSLPEECVRQAIMAGGDLYELCFTASPVHRAAIAELGARLGVRVSCVGSVTEGSALMVYDWHGNPLPRLPRGFDHFRG